MICPRRRAAPEPGWAAGRRRPRRALGKGLTGGERNADDAIVRAIFSRIGAYVMGRRMFDELHVHLAPVLLGAGVRLFDASTADVKLEAGPVKAAPRVTHLAFRVR